jgi:MFS superfamily sulfate permease-like transporter
MQSDISEFRVVKGRLSGPAQEDSLTVYAAGIDDALPRLMICRPTGSLYYANAESLMNEVLSLVRDAPSTLRSFILRFDSIEDVDCVAAKMLMELADRLAREQVALVFADVSKKSRISFPISAFLRWWAQAKYSLQSTQRLQPSSTSHLTPGGKGCHEDLTRARTLNPVA